MSENNETAIDVRRQTSGEMAPPPAPRPALPTLIAPSGQPEYWASWDMSTPAGIALAMRCHGQADLSGADVVNTTVRIREVFSHFVDLTDKETGEVTRCVRCVLVRDDEKTIGFVSDGVRKCLAFLFGARGVPPWDPPLPLRLRQVERPGGHRLYLLDLVVDDPAATPRPRRKS